MPALLAVCVQHELLLLFIYKGVNGVMAFCVIIFELREHRFGLFQVLFNSVLRMLQI